MYENILFAFLPHHEGVGFLLIKDEQQTQSIDSSSSDQSSNGKHIRGFRIPKNK